MKIKSGLEIHQQLNTNKLFCNCPSILRNDEPGFKVSRKLHAVAGESGEVDIAAKYESIKDKEFIYQGYDTTCLVELDEEPPYPINLEALQIGLHIALLLNCDILPITQIMRKTVINGSNTSGFQRTVLIARNGYVETKDGRVRIDNVSLEEDAARIVREEKSIKTFRLDRLGIPLIEIGTAPDIKSPEQCKEVALHIGDILRSCNVKRGIGTIRQDVNISIPGHPRVEIKGFQDVKMFLPVINNEIKRQEIAVKENKLKGEVRNALQNGKTEFLRPMPGAARMYPETDLPLLKITREMINGARRSLPRLKSEVEKELAGKGLREDEIKILLKKNKLEDFQYLLKLINDPKFVYKILIEIPREVEKNVNKNIGDILTLDIIERIIGFVKKDKLDKFNIKHVMEELVKGNNLEQAIKIERVDLSEIETEVSKLIKNKPGLTEGGYMGLIMNMYKGQISGKEVSDILKKLIK